MMPSPSYHAKRFNLEGLTGISDHALKLHFKPYEGYVQEANRLTDRIGSCLRVTGMVKSVRTRCRSSRN